MKTVESRFAKSGRPRGQPGSGRRRRRARLLDPRAGQRGAATRRRSGRRRPAGAAARHRRVLPRRAAAAGQVSRGHRIGRPPCAAAGGVAPARTGDEPAPPGGAGFASVAGRGEPFRFLRDAEADKLVRVLAGERPQTIALVLSHLPPQQAGSVLARLQPALQNEVVRRLVDLEETDPEILREVEQALQSRLSEQVQMQRRRVAGLAAVAGILQASDGRTGMQILDNLAASRPRPGRAAWPPAAGLRRPGRRRRERPFGGGSIDRRQRAGDRPDRRGGGRAGAFLRPAAAVRGGENAQADRIPRPAPAPRRGRGPASAGRRRASRDAGIVEAALSRFP